MSKQGIIYIIAFSLFLNCYASSKSKCYCQNTNENEYRNYLDNISVELTDSTLKEIFYFGHGGTSGYFSFIKSFDTLFLKPITDTLKWDRDLTPVYSYAILKKEYILLCYKNKTTPYSTKQFLIKKKNLDHRFFISKYWFWLHASRESYYIRVEHRTERRYCRKIRRLFKKSCNCKLYPHSRNTKFM